MAARWLDIRLTGRCDGACGYCSLLKDPLSGPERLDTATVRRAIDGAVASGVDAVVLMGGEPTLRDDLPAILRGRRGRQLRQRARRVLYDDLRKDTFVPLPDRYERPVFRPVPLAA